jgi:Fic family protein
MAFLTAEQQRLLAEGYKPFGTFAEWENLNVNRFLWDKLAGRLASRRANTSPEDWLRARQVVIRGGMPDVSALGGGNLTLSPTQASWVQALAARGQEGMQAVFSAELRAHDLVLETVRTREPLTEAWVRNLHAELCSGQETYVVTTERGETLHHPIPKGKYKVLPNHAVMTDGTFYAYAPIDRVQQEVERFVEEMSGDRFEQAHPVLQAAYALHVVSVVHPFADGNGRVSRLLASLYFYRAIGLPLVVTGLGRGIYLRCVEESERGKLQPLVDYAFRRGTETMTQVLDLLDGWSMD